MFTPQFAASRRRKTRSTIKSNQSFASQFCNQTVVEESGDQIVESLKCPLTASSPKLDEYPSCSIASSTIIMMQARACLLWHIGESIVKEYPLAGSELPYTALLACIVNRSLVVISPSGLLRLWRQLPNETAWYETSLALQGNECHSVSSCSESSALIATKQGNIYVINLSTMVLRPINQSRGMLATVSSYIFGGRSVISSVKRLLVDKIASDCVNIYLLSDDTLYIWNVSATTESLQNSISIKESVKSKVTAKLFPNSCEEIDISCIDLQVHKDGICILLSCADLANADRLIYAVCQFREEFTLFNITCISDVGNSLNEPATLLFSNSEFSDFLIITPNKILCCRLNTNTVDHIPCEPVGWGNFESRNLILCKDKGLIAVSSTSSRALRSLQQTLETSPVLEDMIVSSNPKLRVRAGFTLFLRGSIEQAIDCVQSLSINVAADAFIELGYCITDLGSEGEVINQQLQDKLKDLKLLAEFIEVLNLWEVSPSSGSLPCGYLILDLLEQVNSTISVRLAHLRAVLDLGPVLSHFCYRQPRKITSALESLLECKSMTAVTACYFDVYAAADIVRNEFKNNSSSSPRWIDTLRPLVLKLIGQVSVSDPGVAEGLYEVFRLDLQWYLSRLESSKNDLNLVADYNTTRYAYVNCLCRLNSTERATQLAEFFQDLSFLASISVDNPDLVQRYSIMFPGFLVCLEHYLLDNGKPGKLLQLSKSIPDFEFKSHPELLWVADAQHERYTSACNTLLQLSTKENSRLAAKNRMLSLAKLAALVTDCEQPFEEIERETKLVELQTNLPQDVINSYSIDPNTAPVLSAANIAELYTCDENENPLPEHFANALRASEYVENGFEESRVEVWCKALNFTGWNSLQLLNAEPLISVKDTFFFRLASLLYDTSELNKFLPDIDALLNNHRIEEIKCENLENVLSSVYEHFLCA